MDKQTATQLIGNTFNYPFDEGRFRNFAINLLNDVDEGKGFDYLSGNYIRHSFKNHITKYKRLGTYSDPNGDKIDVLVVHLKNEWALERSRTMLRNFTSDYLKNRDEKDAALVAYYTTNPDDWRFSYIRMDYKRVQDESGKFKIKEDITPAKRYSFLVGKNEPNHTAQSQLVGILADDRNNPTLTELETAFSVDAVTKQFYKDYRDQFEKIWNELNSILEKDPKIATEFETKTIDTANFAKKLMGQIVFLYFLQKKGWLGVGKDDSGNYKEWGTGPKNFLRQLFGRKFTDYKNFFNDILEPLFYVGLASEHDGDVFPFLHCKVPFLNGGLFEPMNGYNWRETDIRIDNDIIAGVLDTFDQYNFTVREDEPLEKEVAVDPEMLGKVFENLLPENLRKGKGAYYTPRTIVHYMCQESLINYLDTVIQSSRLNMSHKQDACNTLYFDNNSPSNKHKRNLPHWEQDNVSYFLTFRLWDSIPKEIAEKIKDERESWKKLHQIESENDLQKLDVELKKEYYRLFSKRIDDLLDNGHGSCVLKDPEISKIVENALNHFADDQYLLDHWVIMPNHVHVLVKPLDNWTLEKITHSWKSFTANEINKKLKREGQLWMHESFDHIVRSPDQFLRIRQYIKDNPKNLPSSFFRLNCNSTILVESKHKQDACDTIPKEDIETLIREGDIILELETAIVEQGKKYDSVLMDSIKENAQALDDALANIKVCDPAIGSGAFPVGMLTEIVKARTVLSLYLQSNSSTLLESGHEQDARNTYNLKRHCIQNSLYGVDIDPGAIEIAKLRLWLSLVVDEDDYTSIQPLPNLDYKIMQGNSLIEEFHGISLDIEKKEENVSQGSLLEKDTELDGLISDLHEKLQKQFNAVHHSEKQQSKLDVENAMIDIFHFELKRQKKDYFSELGKMEKVANNLQGETKKTFLKLEKEKIKIRFSGFDVETIESELFEMTHGNKERNFFPWKLYFADVFREKGGFDVVIANPPYIGEKGNKDIFKEIKKTKFGRKHYIRKMDLFYFFFHRSLDISKQKGVIHFITTNYYLTATAGKLLRSDLYDRSSVSKLINFNELKIFETAQGQHNLLTLLQRENAQSKSAEVYYVKKGGFANDTVLNKIFEKDDKDTIYYSIDNSSLFKGKEKYIHIGDYTFNKKGVSIKESILDKIKVNGDILGRICKVNQGILSGADKVTTRHINKNLCNSSFNGNGVYVLSDRELKQLNLSKKEMKIIMPWFKNSDVKKYYCKTNSSKHS